MLPHSTSTRATRFRGLDGLRAIAVGLVLTYHLFPTLLPGGFLGVDVFFAISGFLITSLLLRERERHGTIQLLSFWRRRARRLLPALALVLLVCTTLALLVGGDLLVGIGGQIFGASLFMSNWLFIANGADYFARDTPELFRNTWSLSIEEQFYILLPLLVLALWRLRGRITQALPLLALATTSALLMAKLSIEGADATRIYFGSDTHTFGLLLGAAVAMLLRSSPTKKQAARDHPGLLQQLVAATIALAGFATLGWLALTLVEGSAASFQGGFQLATLVSLAVVIAVTRPGIWVGQALDVQPLRWIGERSYGIYLWHWPLLLLITGAEAPWKNEPSEMWIVGGLTLLATVFASAISYRFVEQPVRQLGIRTSVRRFFGALRKLIPESTDSGQVRHDHYRRRRVWALTLAAILVATVPATTYAMVTAPEMSSAEAAIARGQAALDQQQRTQSPDDTDRPPKKPEVPAPHPTFDGRDISAVGDSVMLASLPELTAGLPDIQVDAAVSRGLGAGIDVVSGLNAEGSLRDVLVIGLGTNGPIEVEDLESMRLLVQPRPLILVNAHGERDWIPGVNQTIQGFADSHRGVVVADWNGAVTGVPDALAGDGIHPNPSGGEIYLGSVQKALDALDTPEEALGFLLARR